jgi:hypothetical protein
MLEQIIRRDHEDSENSMLSAIERRGGGESEQYALDATRGCMENASLNTGAKCKRCICTVLHNVL